jgi:hypothetical protein
MPFSSSICLTNIGVLPTGSNLNIYSNTDSYSTPFQTNIPLSQLDSNCPFILTNIPDGTTTIKFVDSTSNCCYELLLSPNNLCDLFGIQLTGFSSTTISQIIAGNLISSVGNITDYIIDWYGPDNNTTVAFTSGYGTVFGPYQQTHPFVRISLPGYYVPMIQKIRINGINYSITGGTGFIQANIDCLENQTVEVFPSTCSGNRVEPIYSFSGYNNYYFSNTAAFNTPPEPLSMGFDLDINSNHFAWQFQAYSVSDTIKITFHGNNYPTPIVLEYYTVGQEYTELNVSVIPKTIKVGGGFFKKVTNLSKLLRTENDFLTIEVTPNPVISRTNWELYFKCLNTFNCETCLDSLSPYRFIDSSVTITSLGCNLYKLSANLSGCTNSVLQSSDIYKYLTESSAINSGSLNSEFYGYCSTPNGEIGFNSTLSSGSTSCNNYGVCSVDNTSCSQQPYICDSNPGGFISFNKTNATVGGPGNIYMEFQYLSDLNLYYQSYLTNVLNYGLGTPFDNTNINYYRYFSLVIPIIPSNDPNRTCASDTGNQAQYSIHTSSVVTTGITGNFYFLNITMPLTTLGITFDSCDLGCLDYADSAITILNSHSIGSGNQYSFYSNVGAKKLNPISQYVKLVKYTSGEVNANQQSFLRLTNLVNNTIPMSGDSYTIIPSLSAQTCDFSGFINNGTYLGVTRYVKYAWNYTTNVSLLNYYNIFTVINGSQVLIYQYNLNTNTLIYKDPTYFI